MFISSYLAIYFFVFFCLYFSEYDMQMFQMDDPKQMLWNIFCALVRPKEFFFVYISVNTIFKCS